MKYTFDCDRWEQFSMPSKVVDKYIKLSDGDFVKIASLHTLFNGTMNATVQSLREKSGFQRHCH